MSAQLFEVHTVLPVLLYPLIKGKSQVTYL